MQHYRDLGWRVTDTRYGNPFDAVATKGQERIYLEAKGTQSPGETVFLTRGEVEHARANGGLCILGIWASMQFDANDEIDPLTGTFRIMAFNPTTTTSCRSSTNTGYPWTRTAADDPR